MSAKKIDADFTPAIRQLEINSRNSVSSDLIGNYRSSFKGRGLEFEGYRAYTPDDDASRIDWLASMRANTTVVKEYMEERNLEVFFLQDACSAMVFGSQKKLKNEYAAEVTASLAYAILQSGDKVGMGMFSDKVSARVPISSGLSQYHLIMNNLANPANYGGKCSLSEGLKVASTYLRRGTLLIIVSDFLGMGYGWRKLLGMAGKKFELIGINIRDQRDMSIPKEVGQIMLSDAESGRQGLFDAEQDSKLFEDAARRDIAEVRSAFLENGADFLTLYTHEGFVKPVMSFFKRRRDMKR